MYSQRSTCFWHRYNAAWPFRAELSSGHAVPTAAVCSARELRWQLGCSLTQALSIFQYRTFQLSCHCHSQHTWRHTVLFHCLYQRDYEVIPAHDIEVHGENGGTLSLLTSAERATGANWIEGRVARTAALGRFGEYINLLSQTAIEP